ncbi:MAG: hypothetical protein Q8S21_05385 [Candidatus Paracaedibacteraceae bacterium]|nr:hypothetical protein [Candidatus Paracaedibacteraceae bacterium]
MKSYFDSLYKGPIANYNASSWDFSKSMKNNKIKDISGNNFDLFLHRGLGLYKNEDGAIFLDGKSCWLETTKPVLCTNKSFSVATCLRLSVDPANQISILESGVNAVTAVSQESKQLSSFHLGVRIKGEKSKMPPRWCFTLSPEKGDNDVHGCQDAFSNSYIDQFVLEKWFFLIGVCDYDKWEIRLHVPQLNEITIVSLPKTWVPWHADQKTIVGRGKWSGENVDKWPGYINQVLCFSEALNENDVTKLYNDYFHFL